MITSLLVALLIAVPDPRLTPGAVRPLSVSTICTTAWRRDYRHVTVKMRRAVFAAYHLAWADRGRYEVDHLIPRQLGGADVVANLWPQPKFEARRIKDPDETRAHKLVCAGTLSLAAAQAQMRAWGR